MHFDVISEIRCFAFKKAITNIKSPLTMQYKLSLFESCHGCMLNERVMSIQGNLQVILGLSLLGHCVYKTDKY